MHFLTFVFLCLHKPSQKKNMFPCGLEPPTFRLTAERANRLRHGDLYIEHYKTNTMLEKW